MFGPEKSFRQIFLSKCMPWNGVGCRQPRWEFRN